MKLKNISPAQKVLFLNFINKFHYYALEPLIFRYLELHLNMCFTEHLNVFLTTVHHLKASFYLIDTSRSHCTERASASDFKNATTPRFDHSDAVFEQHVFRI